MREKFFARDWGEGDRTQEFWVIGDLSTDGSIRPRPVEDVFAIAISFGEEDDRTGESVLGPVRDVDG